MLSWEMPVRRLTSLSCRERDSSRRMRSIIAKRLYNTDCRHYWWVILGLGYHCLGFAGYFFFGSTEEILEKLEKSEMWEMLDRFEELERFEGLVKPDWLEIQELLGDRIFLG